MWGHTQYTPDAAPCEVIHNTLQMQPHVVSFYRVTSRIGVMFLFFPQVSRNCRYESEPQLKPSPLTCYKQFGTNSIIMLMFVESQRVHIQSTCRVCNKTLECGSIKLKIYIYCYLKCIVYDKLLKPRQSFRITLYIAYNTTVPRAWKVPCIWTCSKSSSFQS